jgi:hypothetical protein
LGAFAQAACPRFDLFISTIELMRCFALSIFAHSLREIPLAAISMSNYLDSQYELHRLRDSRLQVERHIGSDTTLRRLWGEWNGSRVGEKETHTSCGVDAISMRLHIASAVPEAFFLKGGTMRSARRPRVQKSVPTVKLDTATFFAAAGICQEAKVTRGNAARNDWAIPRGMARIPTHAVHVANERRVYPRAQLQLPMRILRIAGHLEPEFDQVMTIDISSSGLRTSCPFQIPVGTPVHLEVELVKRPSGCGTVRLVTQAQVVRAVPDSQSQGWHTLAFSFDEISFERDELASPQFAHL